MLVLFRFLALFIEREMNLKKKDFKNWDRNYFILSKGHCAPTLLLVILKFLTLKSLLNLRKLNSVTQGHTDLRTLNWVGASTGSWVKDYL